MPKDLKGRKRPADVISNAVHVMQIATGEIEESLPADAMRRGRASKGGKGRAKALSKTKRASIAKKAALARWNKNQTRSRG
jgi:hypothetical protein